MTSLSGSVQSAYGMALGDAFYEAVQAAGLVQKQYKIGGRQVCVQYAGEALVPLLAPALDHLLAGSGTASLTISAWDTWSTGVPPPPAFWTDDDLLPRGELRGYTDGPERLTWHTNPAVMSFYDAAKGRACFWIDDARNTPYYESGSPFRSILHWWSAQLRWHMVHAAAVGTQAGGALIAGKGGVGKSNTALSCIGHLLYAADDYCAIEPGARPVVHSLYSTAKISDDDLPLYPHLADAVGNKRRAADEKGVLYLQQYRPQDVAQGFPLSAIFVPRRSGRLETTAEEAPPVAGLQALAPSTIFQLPGAGRDTLRLLADVCGRVPCYYLNLGTDRSRIAAVLSDILAKIL